MPRKDRIHDAVRTALVKDGWTITDDPFRIHYEDADVYTDSPSWWSLFRERRS